MQSLRRHSVSGNMIFSGPGQDGVDGSSGIDGLDGEVVGRDTEL